MSKYRHALPQLQDKLFLTDGGLETTLIFHEGYELPHFASFALVNDKRGAATLRNYTVRYAAIARDQGTGFIFETPTWRASADWGDKMGHNAQDLVAINQKSVEMIREVRNRMETSYSPMVISGNIGPRGDGYVPGEVMTVGEAQAYHSAQVNAFADTAADLVTAITINNVEEAIGIVLTARAADMPVVIGFTVETDGRLPTGQELGDAINEVDTITGYAPAYYMINCAHTSHFWNTLAEGGAWRDRVKGLRANASACSHAELDEAEHLDDGDPYALGRDYAELTGLYPHINILGGCCGTDHRHIECMLYECQQAAA